ncbi:unnamed protein product [Adineta steineri]|uniref:NHL repeat containing protein-like protein n=1 Tax=Adineta steineri TaxID=433720 RepID=A0A818YAP1_9BILA|nr:unnamed protein product [Adineta steineri]
MLTSTSTITTTTTSTTTAVTFIPTGIYALTIPTCATWSQLGITVAGNANGTSGSDLYSLSGPVGIFIDNNDTLYIADRDNNRIMMYYANAASGLVVAGDFTAGSSSSQLNSPKGVAVDQYGSIIVADSSNYRIQSFPSGSMVANTIAMNSAANPLGQLRDLHIDVNNNIYVTDSDYNRVVKFSTGNAVGVVLAPTNGTGSAANQLLGPFGNFIDGNQTLYIADTRNSRVQMWISDAISGITVAGETGVAGSSLALLSNPEAITVDNNGYVNKVCIKTIYPNDNDILTFIGRYIYVVDEGNARVVKWTTNYTTGGVCVVSCSGIIGSANNELNGPRDVKFDSQGNLYITDQANHRIQKFLIQLPTSPCSP